MKKSATLSVCRLYRYALWRTWDDSKPYALFIGLNPSTADETEDDPTIRRCISFARDWGFGGLCMANLFAFRTKDPREMMLSSEPIGVENDAWLKSLSADAGIVVAAWGNDGGYLGRSAQIIEAIPTLHCLKLNKSGEPAHPLYLSGALRPLPLINN